MKIDAQCRNFNFWENILEQITFDDIKWSENKAFWSKKAKEEAHQTFARLLTPVTE